MHLHSISQVCLLISLFPMILTAGLALATPTELATAVVATRDSSEDAKTAAQFVGDGEGDQEEINAAIRTLPPPGGTVVLMEGIYDIRKVDGKLGGVLIERGNVTLAGQGSATKLI